MLNNYINEWLKGLSNSHTRDTYGRRVIEFKDYNNLENAQEISQIHIEDYLNQVTEGSKRTARYALKSFFEFLYKKQLLNWNPSDLIDVDRVVRERKPYIEKDEFEKLYKSIKDENDKNLVRTIYLEELKATEAGKRFGINRQEVWKIIKGYHPIATVEMIKNSLDYHKKELAEQYLNYLDLK